MFQMSREAEFDLWVQIDLNALHKI